jgi:hypothetical protein
MDGKRDGRPEDAEQSSRVAPSAAADPGDAVPAGVKGAGGEAPVPEEGAARDPGDAVPPGVAPMEPPEPSEEERRVLEKLRDLPRGG